MQETIFRAQGIYSKDWIKDWLQKTSHNFYTIAPIGSEFPALDLKPLQIDTSTLGRSLGYFDAQKKEIFEGDITTIKYGEDYVFYEIVWSQEFLRFGAYELPHKSVLLQLKTENSDLISKMRVWGNIYDDSPEFTGKEFRVFISQPMNGKTKQKIELERNEIIEKIKKEHSNVKIIDSFFEEEPIGIGRHKDLGYLAHSLLKMSSADLVVFAKGWKKARGCKLEHDCAVAYSLKIKEL